MLLRLTAAVGLEQRAMRCQPPCSGGYRCSDGLCVEACDPGCKRGFECIAGRCQALCHPPCEGEEVCSPERRCGIPAPPDASDAGVSPDAGVPAAGTATEQAPEAGDKTDDG